MAIMNSYSLPIEPSTTPAPKAVPTPRELAAVIYRQRWIVLGTILLVGLATLVAGVWTPEYAAQMKLMVVRNRVDSVISPEAVAPVVWGADQVSEEDLNSEVELLKSTDLLRKVVTVTGLDQDASYRRRTPEQAVEAATTKLQKHLKVEAVRKTNMIAVRYESRNPQMTSKVLNALSDAYEEKHVEVHRPSGELKFFDQQVSDYKRGLDESQQKILQMSQETGTVSPQQERDFALQRANEFDASASQAEQTVQEDTTRLATLRQQVATSKAQVTGSVRTSSNEVVIGQLKEKLSALEIKRTELLGRYTPTYRLVQDLDGEIAQVKSSIAKETSNPLREETTTANPVRQWAEGELARTEAEITTMQTRATAASAMAAQYRAKADRLNRQSMTQANLVRDAKAQEDNYLLYMQKREAARSSDALDRRGILNVAVAQHPVTPSYPLRNIQYAAMMTLLLGLTFGVSAAFVADSVALSFRTPDEVTRYLEIPVLACLPKSESV
jgi:uncharacterized protein involved in exopolysaccharide biosynthesis